MSIVRTKAGEPVLHPALSSGWPERYLLTVEQIHTKAIRADTIQAGLIEASNINAVDTPDGPVFFGRDWSPEKRDAMIASVRRERQVTEVLRRAFARADDPSFPKC